MKKICILILLGITGLAQACTEQNVTQKVDVKVDVGDEVKKIIDQNKQTNKIKSISVFPEELNLIVDQEKKLTATVRYIDDSTDSDVNWDISDTSIASISDNGTIKGLNQGETSLTVISAKDAEKRLSLTIKVSPVAEDISSETNLSSKDAGQALLLGTEKSYAEAEAFSNHNFSNAFSVESWININSYTAKENQLFFPVISNGTNYSIIINENKSLEVKINDQKFILQDNPYTFRTWYHLAITWDGTKISFYKNGKLISSAEYISESLGNISETKLFIGTNQDKSIFANGLFDEVRIWDKALTQSEIRKNMHLVSNYPENLKAYWQFNQDEQSMADNMLLYHNCKFAKSTVPIFKSE